MAKASEISMMNNGLDPDDEGAFIILDFRGDKLDPAPLLSLIKLTPVRPKKKGDPLGPSRGGRTPVAKIGYCGFSTMGKASPQDGNAHLAILLKTVSDHIVAIRQIMLAQSLEWRAVFFEGHAEGGRFSDLRPELIDRAAQIGLPLLPSENEVVTIVEDFGQSDP